MQTRRRVVLGCFCVSRDFTIFRQDWSKCDNVPDFVTVYDGYTTRDPILLRFCGSGETVPVTTSSGPELLVQFSTSPYGTLMYPFGPLHGFQLQVQVSTFITFPIMCGVYYIQLEFKYL